MNRALFLAAAVVVLAGCTRNGRPLRDEIKFAHGDHLGGDMSCVTCHPGATEDAEPLAALVPPEEQCRDCHRERGEDRCGFCHTVPQEPATYARRDRRVRFDHRLHDEPMRGECVTCHASQSSQASLADFDVHLPPMATCTDECHAAEMRQLRCVPCHVDLHEYALAEIAIYRHPTGFLRGHAAAARTEQTLCTSCHEPSFCEDCHMSAPSPIALELVEPTNVTRHFVHRGDFRSRHALEARMEQGTCLRCHGVPFCDDCHTASGIGGGVAPGSPHPPGWLDPLSPRGHAAEARRDILSCASCHEADAERTCVPCHRVGGVAPNPHPPGFGATMDPLRHGVCRVCHVP
jgi:hypothetical protein